MAIRTFYGRLRKRYTAEDVQANVQRRMLRLAPGDAPSGARAAPTLSTPARTVWNTATTPKSTSVGGTGSGNLSWGSGDRIVILGMSSDQAIKIDPPTGPAGQGLGGFGALSTPQSTANSCWAQAWTTIANFAGSGVITATLASGANDWGLIAWVIPTGTCDGIGAIGNPAASTTQTASLTRLADNSVVVEVIGDWGAGVGGVGTVPSPRNWTPAGFTEIEAFGVSGIYNGYAASWGDQGTAGTTAYGIAVAASGGNYTRLAVEVLGAATGGGATNDAPAEVGAGAGVGADAQAAAGANADFGAATGTAPDQVLAAGATDSGASGTGSAPDATVSTATATNAAAEVASATGTALDAQATVSAQPGSGAATGTGQDPQPAVGANAEAATGTGAAPDATVTTTNVTNAAAETASATGTAPDPQAGVGATAEVTSGSGAALDAVAGAAIQTTTATAAGTGTDPVAAIGANAESATGTGTALDATVSTAAIDNAPAEAATGAGTASDPAATVGTQAGLASATGSGPDATVQTGIAPQAEAATGTGSAPDPTVTSTVNVPAGQATGAGSALDAAGQVGINALAGTSLGTGAVFDAVAAIAVLAEAAAALGAAPDATGVSVLPFTIGVLTATTDPLADLVAATRATSVPTATAARGGPS